jgi:hypothetical protein
MNNYFIHDNLFDFRFLNEIGHGLLNSPWLTDNVANRNRWPYFESGTHRLLGNLIFKQDQNEIYENKNHSLFNVFLSTADFLKGKFLNENKKLKEIYTNLQFKGMDGTFHVDGEESEVSFVWMLTHEPVFKNIGGDFLFYPNEKIDFLNGRIIQFSAEKKHKGLSFKKNNICRFSVKFLFS